MNTSPFGNHCLERCPDGLPHDGEIDANRAKLFNDIGALGVRCPHIGTARDGGGLCNLGYALYNNLTARSPGRPLSVVLCAANAVVDGALSLEELPIDPVADKEDEKNRWRAVDRLMIQRGYFT